MYKPSDPQPPSRPPSPLLDYYRDLLFDDAGSAHQKPVADNASLLDASRPLLPPSFLVAPAAPLVEEEQPAEIQDWEIEATEQQVLVGDAIDHETVVYETAAHETVVHEAVENDTVERNTIEHDTIEHDTIEHDTIEHDTIEHDTIEYSISDSAAAEQSTAENLSTYRASEWLENGRPEWAQENFDVLLFSVSGFSLAVPLITLGQIQPITDELTSIFGQAKWFMGLQPSTLGKIRVVNTALFVMPERYQPPSKPPEYVVTLAGTPWGLAVDKVNQPIRLQPGDVKWRKDRQRQVWMAGVVKKQMCVLLDVPTLGRYLLDLDKQRNRLA